jgi:Exo-beta-D-glucosaminidase Ig-fold domain
MSTDDRKVLVVNTTLKKYEKLRASATLLDEKGRVILKQESDIELRPNSKEDCFSFTLPSRSELPEVYFTQLVLADEAGTVLTDNFYWESRKFNEKFYSFNTLDKVALAAEGEYLVAGDKVSGKVEISNPSETLALCIKLNLRDSDSGEPILPAYFSDGYFSLMPGEKREIIFDCKKANLPEKFNISAEGYNVERQTILD